MLLSIVLWYLMVLVFLFENTGWNHLFSPSILIFGRSWQMVLIYLAVERQWRYCWSEYTQDDYETLKKHFRVLYILQCALDDKIFNHVCSCEIVKDLWKDLSLIYEERSQENRDSSRRENMLSSSNDEKEITHFCLMANKV